MSRVWEIRCTECNEVIGYSNDYRGNHDLRTLCCEDCKSTLEDDEDDEE